MDILIYIWNHLLYIPLFNALIWLYNGLAEGNLGYAVILLTLALRVILLPLSVVSERNKAKFELLERRVESLQRDFKNDPETMKEKVRKLLKLYKISPWAKTLVIAVQALVLVLLYQVFIGGLTHYKLNVLYKGVDRPEFINTNFYGFELGAHDWRWAAVVGLVLFLEIYFYQRGKHVKRSDQLYAIFFPIMSFLALWALPMVKSIFILTTLAFSYILSMFRSFFYSTQDSE